MVSPRLANYLRTYRRKSGLTQSEVAFLLGWKTGAQVSRYEKRHCLPPLRTALACEEIFKIPTAELFAGIRDSVAKEVSQRVAALSLNLQSSKDQERVTSRKLKWLSERHGLASPANKPVSLAP